MPKRIWEATTPNKARCEICKGSFGLRRQRYAQKQFCSKHCLERYLAERIYRISSLKHSTNVTRRKSNPV
jgi:hypothetical protein